MAAVSIAFENSNDEPIYLQIDPWAGLYFLKKREKIEIVTAGDNSSSFSIDEQGNTRILSLDGSGYYVVLNGERIHWEKYPLDSRLCKFCIKALNSEDWSGNVCKCG